MKYYSQLSALTFQRHIPVSNVSLNSARNPEVPWKEVRRTNFCTSEVIFFPPTVPERGRNFSASS